MSEVLELPLASIEVGTDRARLLDPAWAEGLAAIIQMQGLLHPISVRPARGEDQGYALVSGLHRLEAFRLLNRADIPVTISVASTDDEARLEEVMENLGRHELIALDRCHHLYELKQVWERLYPHAKHGGDHGNQHTGGKSQNLALATDAPEIFGFARATAEKIGLGISSIKADVRIWAGLAPQTCQRLQGTEMARKRTELKALSDLPSPRKQGQVLDAIFNDELPDVGNVAQALAYLDGTIACDPLERRFETVSKSIAALDDALFDDVIAAHEGRVMASLKRRGRI